MRYVSIRILFLVVALGIAILSLSFVSASLAVVEKTQTTQAEITFWNSVRDSSDASELEAYLKAFPNGNFALLARIRINRLQATGLPQKDPTASLEPAATMPPLIARDRGLVGIEIKNVPKVTAQKLRLRGNKGTIVISFLTYGPAARAGIKKGDIIVSVDGRTVFGSRGFVAAVGGKKPGAEIKIALFRNGEERAIKLKVGAFARDLFAAAKAGSILPMHTLARYLDQGNIFKKNPQQATRWIWKGAMKGDPTFQLYMGNRYHWGAGIQKNTAESVRWYNLAAANGNTHAMFVLGRMYNSDGALGKDTMQAAKWYKKAVAKGHSGAMTNLAVLYKTGDGVPKDQKRHIELLRAAMDKKQAEAFANLGIAYTDGSGVPIDISKAFFLWRQAGELGSGSGWRFLGNNYREGVGVKKNRSKAIEYYRKAAVLNDRKSISELKKFGVSIFDPATIQRQLADLGFDPGAIDGRPGRKTRQAIKAFARKYNLASDGKMTQALADALNRVLGKQLRKDRNTIGSQDNNGGDDLAGFDDFK